mmetsp:Transcript_28117/g.84145  ORF Transcript_28117/g.84145 Transcript_28117/m.84145 type:complete len:233 (+) Transcript_28117:603-1301(+)
MFLPRRRTWRRQRRGCCRAGGDSGTTHRAAGRTSISSQLSSRRGSVRPIRATTRRSSRRQSNSSSSVSSHLRSRECPCRQTAASALVDSFGVSSAIRSRGSRLARCRITASCPWGSLSRRSVAVRERRGFSITWSSAGLKRGRGSRLRGRLRTTRARAAPKQGAWRPRKLRARQRKPRVEQRSGGKSGSGWCVRRRRRRSASRSDCDAKPSGLRWSGGSVFGRLRRRRKRRR